MSKGGKVPAASAGATMMSKFLSKTATETDLERCSSSGSASGSSASSSRNIIAAAAVVVVVSSTERHIMYHTSELADLEAKQRDHFQHFEKDTITQNFGNEAGLFCKTCLKYNNVATSRGFVKSPSNNLDVKKACADHLKTEQHKTAVLNQVRRDGIDSLRPSTVKQQIATMFQVSEKALNIRILKIYDMVKNARSDRAFENEISFLASIDVSVEIPPRCRLGPGSEGSSGYTSRTFVRQIVAAIYAVLWSVVNNTYSTLIICLLITYNIVRTYIRKHII